MTSNCCRVSDGLRVDAEFWACCSGENEKDDTLRDPCVSMKMSRVSNSWVDDRPFVVMEDLNSEGRYQPS